MCSDKFVESGGSLDGEMAEWFIEDNFAAVLTADVKDGPFRHENAQHFFQAHGLGTELDFVVVPASFFATFEIDGVWDFRQIGSRKAGIWQVQRF